MHSKPSFRRRAWHGVAIAPLALAAASALGQALPTGGQVVAGQGRITTSGSGMVVNQGSQRLVTDWQSFSIGAGHSVRFVQPSSSSVALNRVTGGDPSRILGSLSANGHVYLTNPNGVLFGAGAQVDVGSLVASSLNADLDGFLAGRLRLSGADGAGEVRNDGRLTTAQGGHVVLAGPRVSNHGSITTPGGTTALAAAAAVEVDATGAGLLSVRVPLAAVQAKLVNLGSIRADGGAVQLHAAAADAAREAVMQVGGVVRARSVERRDGRILLSGGASGVVVVDGTLDASGGAGRTGGRVSVLGDAVALVGNARIDVSGGAGGGTVLVGGNWQGLGPEPNAHSTWIGSGVAIDASATDLGDGGTVVVWADSATGFHGAIAARGGARGGDGGKVEVSGKQGLDFAGKVDTRAPAGQQGLLLLDPSNIVVGTVADIDNNGTPGDDLDATTNPLLAGDFTLAGTSFVTAGAVAGLLATTDVTLQAFGNVLVSTPISVAAGGAATTLTLGGNTIAINAALNLNNASLDAAGAQQVAVSAPVTSLGSVRLASLDVAIGAIVNAPQVRLEVPVGAVSANLREVAGGGIVALDLVIDGDPNATVTLDTTLNRVGSLRFLDGGSATVRVDNPSGTALRVAGSLNAGLNLVSAGAVTQDAGPAGALSLGDDFTLTTLLTTGANNVALTNPANSFANLVQFNVGQSIGLAATGPLAIAGDAGGAIALTSTGVLSLSGDLAATGGNITLTSAGFNAGTGQLLVQPGSRFLIDSSNWLLDNLGTIGLSANGAVDVNFIAFGGYAGAVPAARNGYLTNRTGTIAVRPNVDVPNTDGVVQRVYDGTTALAYTQSGTSGQSARQDTLGGTSAFEALASYALTSIGSFANRNAGTGKGYTVAATNATTAVGATSGATFLGLQAAGFTRAAGVLTPSAPGTLVAAVTPRALTSSGLTAVDRIYDGTVNVTIATGGASLANTVGGDAVTLASATGTMADKNAGNGKAVTVGVVLGGADAGNYTVTDASAATVDIARRALTSGGLAGIDRAYDGSTAVGIATGGATLSNLVTGDAVTVAAATGTMANKNVGTNKALTVAVTLGGADAANYTVTDASGATATISPRTVTSNGIAGVDRVYDGSVGVALDGSAATLGNVVAGDAVSLSLAGASGTMADKNAGAGKAVTVTGLALGGADAANYQLVDASTPTVTISRLALTASGIRAFDKVFDGSTAVTVDASGAAVVGVLAGDVVGVDGSGASGAVGTPAAGVGKPVTVSGLVLTGADAQNYSVLPTPVTPGGAPLAVRIVTVAQAAFEEQRYKAYLQGVSDAQEPFRRAMAEALAAGFGKENIRKPLARGLVFETGLAAPAVDRIEPARAPGGCTAAGIGLACRP